MTNFPKNPKPHISINKPTTGKRVIKNYDKIVKVMLELIRKNKEIVTTHTSSA